MNKFFRLLSLLLLIIVCQYCEAQKIFRITVLFPDSAIAKKTTIEYDNGRTVSGNIPILINNHIELSDSFYSKKAVIYIRIKDSSNTFSNAYFVDEKPAKFIFEKFDLSNKKPVFKIINASTLSDMGEKHLKEFTAKEDSSAAMFFRKNNRKLSKGDSLASINANKIILAVTHKRMEFIKRNSHLYYSFWFFKKNIIGNLLLNPDSLLVFFRNTFPERFKSSYEGNQIITFLNGRLISSAKRSTAPDFTSSDIDGKIVSLKNLRGKYVLISFWATWCLPCVDELPALKNIRREISREKLVFISVSFDKDLLALKEGIKKYDMNWTNIYYDEPMGRKYGVSSLPMLFLINDTGKIIYNRKTDEKQFADLIVLKKLITNLQFK